MNCSNCGASSTSLTCPYCGTYNSDSDDNTSINELDHDELAYEIDLTERKIEKLSKMPMPENMKKKKIELLEKRLSDLRGKE
tara:strand:- start:1607 stop:1852 length:246 start_codon:yes stop_codon:yes gene_type:complete